MKGAIRIAGTEVTRRMRGLRMVGHHQPRTIIFIAKKSYPATGLEPAGSAEENPRHRHKRRCPRGEIPKCPPVRARRGRSHPTTVPPEPPANARHDRPETEAQPPPPAPRDSPPCETAPTLPREPGDLPRTHRRTLSP